MITYGLFVSFVPVNGTKRPDNGASFGAAGLNGGPRMKAVLLFLLQRETHLQSFRLRGSQVIRDAVSRQMCFFLFTNMGGLE